MDNIHRRCPIDAHRTTSRYRVDCPPGMPTSTVHTSSSSPITSLPSVAYRPPSARAIYRRAQTQPREHGNKHGFARHIDGSGREDTNRISARRDRGRSKVTYMVAQDFQTFVTGTSGNDAATIVHVGRRWTPHIAFLETTSVNSDKKRRWVTKEGWLLTPYAVLWL